MTAPIEPSSDIRQMANFWRQTFLALTQAGFTEEEALIIIGHIIRGSFLGGDS